jgi:hypothetical protein
LIRIASEADNLALAGTIPRLSASAIGDEALQIAFILLKIAEAPAATSCSS